MIFIHIFFASGTYCGFERYAKKDQLSDAQILQLAIQTITCDYDAIFGMEEIKDIPTILKNKFDFNGSQLINIKKNKIHMPHSREKEISNLAATENWDCNSKIKELTRIDDSLYDYLIAKRLQSTISKP